MTSIKNFLINEDAVLSQAMEKIDSNGKGIGFVVNASNNLLGTITDGDVRRAILSGKKISSPVDEIMNKTPLVTQQNQSIEECINLINKHQNETGITISILPITINGAIVDYFEYKTNFHAPIASPVLSGNELKYLSECIHTNWISSQGRFVKDFEQSFIENYSSPYAVSTMNGTVALHLAASALGIGPGDEVIIPSLTFAASINAILYTGATPIIVDIEEDSWCISPEEICKNLSSKTKAIMAVHIYGQVCEMDDILSIAKKNNLFIIEDCAESQGAKYKNNFVGTIGDIGCFSFFGNKIVTTGEGGMCLTKNSQLNEKMRKLRDHGMSRDARLYYHDVIGFNYRMTNMQAAVGLAQMEQISQIQNKRNRIERQYQLGLAESSNLIQQIKFPNREKVCWLVSYLLTSNKISRQEFIAKLKEKGIDIRPFFFPLHLMDIYKKFAPSSCPVAESIANNGINFPTSLSFSDVDIYRITSAIKDVLNEIRTSS